MLPADARIPKATVRDRPQLRPLPERLHRIIHAATGACRCAAAG